MGEDEARIRVAAELGVGGDVNQPGPVFQQRALEGAAVEGGVEEHLAPIALLDGAEFRRHAGQGRVALHRFAEPGQEQAALAHHHGLGGQQVHARRSRHRVALEQKTLAVVQGRHGDGAQGTAGHEYQGVDARRGEFFFEGGHQPLVELARRAAIFVGGALGEQGLQAAGLGLHLGPGDGHAIARDAPSSAHQQFQATGQEDRVDDRGPGIDVFDAARGGLELRRAAVAEIVAQLGGLPILHHLAGLDEERLFFFLLVRLRTGPQQQVDEFEIDGLHGLAERDIGLAAGGPRLGAGLGQ